MNPDIPHSQSPLPDTRQIQEDLSTVKRALHSSDDSHRTQRMTIAWGNAICALFLLMVTPIFLIVILIVAASGQAAINETAIVGVTMLIPVLILVCCSLPFLLAAWGLFKGYSWGPGAALIAAVLNLLNIPLGTMLAIYTFVISAQGGLRAPSLQPHQSVSLKNSTFLYLIGGVVLFSLLTFATFFLVGGRFDMADSNFNFHVGNGKTVEGSGVSVSEDRIIRNFQKLDLSVPALVYYKAGKPSLTIEAEENLVPLILSDQIDDTLVLSIKENINTKRRITIHLQGENLSAVKVNGATTLTLNDIETDLFSLEANGATKVTIQGTSDQVEIECGGAASAHLSGLLSKHCTARFSGAASGEVSASESLNATVSGAASVRYSGDPRKVTKEISGAGSIRKR